MATKSKISLPTGTLVQGVRHPKSGKPLYLAVTAEAGIRVGKAGSTGSYLMKADEAVYVLQRLPKSERRLFRKALRKTGKPSLAATDLRALNAAG